MITTSPSIENALRAYHNERSPRARGTIYAQTIRAAMAEPDGAAYVLRASNTLGTASGPLIVQRELDLLKIHFPLLSRIARNFGALDGQPQTARYGQEIITRLVSELGVSDYNTTTGYPVENTTTTDVAVTLDAHKSCQVSFNANEMSGTGRSLFDEQSEAMHYALAKDLMDAIYALFTVGNYTETPTTVAQVDFCRSSVIEIGTAMQTGSANRNANSGMRTLLLSPGYFGQLAKDTVIVGNLNNPQAGSAIGDGTLPMIHGFLPVEAPNLPTTGNLVGFALRADAVALAVRPANDYANAIPGLPATGIVQTVTNPDTGLSVSYVAFVNHLLGRSYGRVAWLRGVAKGNIKAGQIVRSSA